MKHDDFSGILQCVRAFCEAEALLTPLAAGKPLHLAAAVSGGADSMALLHLLLALQAESGFVLSVCHVNHGLRGETADRDEAFVREACAELGLPLRVFRPAEVGFTVPPHAGEDWARRLRYACFEQLRPILQVTRQRRCCSGWPGAPGCTGQGASAPNAPATAALCWA